MKSVLRVRINDDGTLQLPVDGIVAELDRFAGNLVDQIGTLPRKRPPAAAYKSFPAVVAGGTNANRQMSSVTNARLLGFAVRETTGAAAATLELRDGTDATGDLVVPITLAANESDREWFGPNGITFTRGLYLVRLTGTADGAIWLGEV